jgi:hypothetical protein
MTRLIETSNAEWVPGTRYGHHGGCFGFIVDELCYEDLCQSPAKKTQWLFHALGLLGLLMCCRIFRGSTRAPPRIGRRWPYCLMRAFLSRAGANRARTV